MWQGKINKTLYLVGIFVGAWVEIAKANWDEATGYLHDYKPSQAWLSANKPKRCSNNIQIAECAHNTRLAYPDVGTNPIADPQTGRYGFETSPDGRFHPGPVDRRTWQPDHDRYYPGFHLPSAWPKPLPFQHQPNVQPACAAKGQPNLDPGQDGGEAAGYGKPFRHTHRAGHSGRNHSPP
ncbi:secreted protein [Puccinia sorghi]|uniref:Secreted protein n=1 Tax=Puccinia sorghi TaxID=27349 RepID=A0A0L6VJA1_9BASI|nr:secreted protein [Puccinia sorghi]